jgi:hypothetical protein
VRRSGQGRVEAERLRPPPGQIFKNNLRGEETARAMRLTPGSRPAFGQGQRQCISLPPFSRLSCKGIKGCGGEGGI